LFKLLAAMIMRATVQGGDGFSRILACFLTALLLSWGSCAELQLGTRHEAFLDVVDNGLGGSFSAAGDSDFAETSAFKEHLTLLLRSTGRLQRLELNDVDAYQVEPDGVLQWAWSKSFTLPEEGLAPTFVPDKVRIDFSITFNHTRGISQKAIQDSLGEISQAKFWVNSSRHAGRRAQSLAATTTTTTCNETTYTEQCTTACEGYMISFCANCKCKERYGGSPQCTCYLQSLIFINSVLSSTFYALFMLCCGLCMRSTITKYQPLHGSWPNVGGMDFIDGPCAFCNNMNVCCMTCCCPAIRMAMNYWLAGLGNYLTLLIICSLLYAIPGFGGEIVISIMIIIYRRKIRTKLKTHKDTCTDCCCACFCSLCLICQEARTIDEAWRVQQAALKAEEDGKSEAQLVGEALMVAKKEEPKKE
jgi:Cys-rich protein (TIGR01571 family)